MKVRSKSSQLSINRENALEIAFKARHSAAGVTTRRGGGNPQLGRDSSNVAAVLELWTRLRYHKESWTWRE